MAFKTVGDLREWLQQRGDDGERLIGNEWLMWVNMGGNIVVQHPNNPDVGAGFCPIADDEEDE
jgi:hypothetical protein